MTIKGFWVGISDKNRMKYIIKHPTRKTFSESVNWEFVNTHQPIPVRVKDDARWINRIIGHARGNGFNGRITLLGAARVINRHLVTK